MEIKDNILKIKFKHMKRNISLSSITFIIFILLSVVSCTQMDDYKIFIEKGEISYTGKIDSITVFSGDERVLIQGLFIADPKITSCKIYWNSRQDSVEVRVNRTSGVDTLKQIIQLPENLYNFELFTYDALGNKSIPVYAIGRSYGSAYKASLNNKLITSAIVDGDDVSISWRTIDKTLGAFATGITYTDNSGVEQTIISQIDDTKTILKDYKLGSNFSATTLYKPDAFCIDTFYAEKEIHFPLVPIDKTNWIATADTYEPSSKLPDGGGPELAIDGKTSTYWLTRQTFGGSPYPHWLAVDMQKEEDVVAIELIAYDKQIENDFSEFIIQGRADQLEEWANYGTYTLEDIKEPQIFMLSSIAKIRYLRIYQLNGKNQHSYLAELSIYKY